MACLESHVSGRAGTGALGHPPTHVTEGQANRGLLPASSWSCWGNAKKTKEESTEGAPGMPQTTPQSGKQGSEGQAAPRGGTKSHVSVTKGGNSGRHRHEPLADGLGSNPLSAIYYLCD